MQRKLTSNDSRVTGVILRDILLNLAHQVSTHISSLHSTAAAWASEHSTVQLPSSPAAEGPPSLRANPMPRFGYNLHPATTS
jgi:hypothetical protein